MKPRKMRKPRPPRGCRGVGKKKVKGKLVTVRTHAKKAKSGGRAGFKRASATKL